MKVETNEVHARVTKAKLTEEELKPIIAAAVAKAAGFELDARHEVQILLYEVPGAATVLAEVTIVDRCGIV